MSTTEYQQGNIPRLVGSHSFDVGDASKKSVKYTLPKEVRNAFDSTPQPDWDPVNQRISRQDDGARFKYQFWKQ